MKDLIQKYLIQYNKDTRPLEFEQFLALVNNSETIAILEFMAIETERASS